MALSDEQQAMLRLLAQGEQGYGDIAALLGQSEAEVRAKVVGALAQLRAEGKDAPDVPPPVPGGAKPAAEVAPPEPEPEPEPPAEEEPAAEPAIADSVAPKPVKARREERKAVPVAPASRPSADRPSSGGRTVTLPTGRGAWLLGGGVLATIAVIVVVVILLTSGGGSSGSSTGPSAEAPASGTEGSGKEATGAENTASQTPTQAKLTATDGSGAEGLATFGRVEVENKEGKAEGKLALQVEAGGLQPTEKGKNSYTIWIAETPQKMIPLVFPVEVSASGKGAKEIAAQFEVPVETLAYLAAGTFDEIAITRTDDEELRSAMKVATKAKTTPAYLGEPVLRGTISGPIIGLAKREAEEKEKGE